MTTFETFGLAAHLNKALAAANIVTPTPIQVKAIPLALEGHDIMGLAQTGTGKTLAFGLPLIHQLLETPGKPAPRTAKSLILAPTRELVNQIADSLRVVAEGTRLRIRTVVGGQSINKQIAILEKGCDVLVATPGRLIDLMNRGAVDLGSVRQLVLDEADQMLDMGFIHDLRKIAPALGTPRRTMMFSATMPKQMEEISASYLDNPRKVQVSPPGKAADKITQSLHFMEKASKPFALRRILDADPDALTLVFARTKHGAEKLMKGLVADGYAAASIHGNKSQGQRDRALKGFREGTVSILVATDVAARGIDIPGVAYVVNYELPEVPDSYVHRIGRTARAGREGEAVAFCAPEETKLLQQIERLMKISIPVASGTHPGMDRAESPQRKSGRGGPSKGHGSRRKASAPKPQKPASPTGQATKPKRRRNRRRRAA